jgi:hypothetical protein
VVTGLLSPAALPIELLFTNTQFIEHLIGVAIPRAVMALKQAQK